MITDSTKEITELSEKYSEVGQKVVDLSYEFKLLKDVLYREDARLDMEIRRETTKKLTEKEVKNRVLLSETYIQLSEKLLETERKLDEAKKQREDLEMRAEMLKLLGKDFANEKQIKKSFKKF